MNGRPHALPLLKRMDSPFRWVGLGMLAALVISGCHDRNPTTQQPYGPAVPSTSPTSTTPRQPASTQSVMSPSKPAMTLPSPSGSN